MRKPLLLILSLTTLSFSATPKPVPALDQKRIHASYKDGDLDLVSQELEKYSRTFQKRAWLREDSIFLYKHLAVIYSASPETREKGKYYMIAMLRIMPSAEILDMYVSEEVDRIFLRTRQEFMANMHSFGIDTTAMRIPTTPHDGKGVAADSTHAPGTGGKQPIAKSASSSHTGWTVAAWTAGGIALAAAGATTYLLMQEPKTTEKINTIEIPKAKN